MGNKEHNAKIAGGRSALEFDFHPSGGHRS
jgi:hypothetical protein